MKDTAPIQFNRYQLTTLIESNDQGLRAIYSENKQSFFISSVYPSSITPHLRALFGREHALLLALAQSDLTFKQTTLLDDGQSLALIQQIPVNYRNVTATSSDENPI